jgi:hypothetical protein
MSYIGSTPVSQNFIAGTDYFNGTGSAVNFTMSRAVNSVNDIEVMVNNVQQIPSGYSVSGNLLTFSVAPSAGTSNVYVRFLSTTLQSITVPAGTVVAGNFSVTGNLGVGTAAATQKLDVVGNIKWSGATYENVFTITDGASVDLNPANGTIQVWTLGASRSPTATNFTSGQSMTLMVNDGTAYTITWPSVVWVGGSDPTLATTGYTVIVLWEVGTTLYGVLTGSVA